MGFAVEFAHGFTLREPHKGRLTEQGDLHGKRFRRIQSAFCGQCTQGDVLSRERARPVVFPMEDVDVHALCARLEHDRKRARIRPGMYRLRVERRRVRQSKHVPEIDFRQDGEFAIQRQAFGINGSFEVCVCADGDTSVRVFLGLAEIVLPFGKAHAKAALLLRRSGKRHSGCRGAKQRGRRQKCYKFLFHLVPSYGYLSIIPL